MVKANESAQQVLLAAVNTPSQRLIKDINA
jgi:hypothetical protein